MKLNKKIFSVALSSAMIVSTLSMPVSASDFWGEAADSDINSPNLTITADYTAETEIPLTLESSSPVFYCNANLSPGDTATSNVYLTNESDLPIQISITDIENMLPEDEKAKMLLDILQLTITLEDEVYYQGKHSELAVPFMPYVTVDPHESLTLHVSMEFPREADNRYQGAKYKMRWVFDAIAEPPVETTTPPPPPPPPEPEPVKTGVETEKETPSVGFYIALFGIPVALLTTAGVVWAIKKKKKWK